MTLYQWYEQAAYPTELLQGGCFTHEAAQCSGAVTPDKGLVMKICCISNHLLSAGMLCPEMMVLRSTFTLHVSAARMQLYTAVAIFPAFHYIVSRISKWCGSESFCMWDLVFTINGIITVQEISFVAQLLLLTAAFVFCVKPVTYSFLTFCSRWISFTGLIAIKYLHHPLSFGTLCKHRSLNHKVQYGSPFLMLLKSFLGLCVALMLSDHLTHEGV